MTIRSLALVTALSARHLFSADPTLRGVTAHEWGTFTTVADENGKPVNWIASLSNDLPCFVERGGAFGQKNSFPSLVRMETPVIYFYAPNPATVNVRVDFPQGRITEWYPRAETGTGQISWSGLRVDPRESPELPTAKGKSHYFAARETDAATLKINGQVEKLLFYRGIGNFGVPVEARFVEDNRLRVTNTGTAPLSMVVYFENRNGRIAYRVARNLASTIEWKTPEVLSSVESVHLELKEELVRAGLFPKEAAAMIETWRDSWFEAGTRLIYVVPREIVDKVLPLQIEPAPSAVERVFVGRAELLAPWHQERLLTATTATDLKDAGRFLDSFAAQILRTTGNHLNASAYKEAMQHYWKSAAGSCVQ